MVLYITLLLSLCLLLIWIQDFHGNHEYFQLSEDGTKKKTFSGIAVASKAAAKLSTKGKIPKSCRATTMDLAKALGTLGFTSTRWLDMSSGLTPKQELDKAHFAKMMEIMKKKKKKVSYDISGNTFWPLFWSFFRMRKKPKPTKTSKIKITMVKIPNPYRKLIQANTISNGKNCPAMTKFVFYMKPINSFWRNID